MRISKLALSLIATLSLVTACDDDSPEGSGSGSSTTDDPDETAGGSAVTLTATETATATATATDTATTGTTDDPTTGSSSDTTGEEPTTSTTTGGETSEGTSSTGEEGSSSTGEANSCDRETPYDGPGECDPYAQDCDEGERCVPWADDGGATWNSTTCSPIAEDPDQLGEPCEAESGVAGVDSCDAGLMCFDVDTGTGIGECIALCECGPAAPQCGEEGAFCSVSNQGALPICLSPCDPLLEDSCDGGNGCYPISDTFVCAPDASGGNGVQGDPCANINTCDPGLACVTPGAVPDCPAGSTGCCSAFCPLDDASCPDGTECVAWFSEGEAPEGYENVGLCSVPA